MATATRKRKRVVLSIDDKMKIIELFDKSVSYAVIWKSMGSAKALCLI